MQDPTISGQCSNFSTSNLHVLTHLIIKNCSLNLNMPFRSKQPDIHVPTDISIWDWLFNSPASTLNRYPETELRGCSNGLTGERIDYRQVRDVSTAISTALVKKYKLKQGEVVALFSPNNIWYPVAMVCT